MSDDYLEINVARWLARLTTIGIAVAVGVLVVNRVSGGTSGATPSEQAGADPILAVDLDDFYRLGAANEVALEQKLKGHRLQVHGYIGSVESSSDGPKVAVVSRDGSLQASMASPLDQIAALSRDQEVTLVCNELHFSGTRGSRGSDCYVASAGQITAGITHDLQRSADNRSTNEFVGNVLSDAAKNVRDDVNALTAKPEKTPAEVSHDDKPAEAASASANAEQRAASSPT